MSRHSRQQAELRVQDLIWGAATGAGQPDNGGDDVVDGDLKETTNWAVNMELG